MGWKDKVDEVVPGARGARLTAGQYIIHIHEAMEKETEDRRQYCIHRGEILQSSNAEFPTGCEMSEAVRMDSRFPNHAMEAAGQAKAFCAAVTGIEPRDTATVMREVTRQVIDGVYSARNPARGSILALKVYPRPLSQKARDEQTRTGVVKPPYMVHEWHPVIEGGKPAFKALPPMATAPAGQGGWGQPQPTVSVPSFGQAPGLPTGGWGGAVAGIPGLPGASVPGIPGLPPVAPAFPPAGWEVHPNDQSYFFVRGTDKVLKEADLRALVAVGKA